MMDDALLQHKIGNHSEDMAVVLPLFMTYMSYFCVRASTLPSGKLKSKTVVQNQSCQ